MNDDLDPKRRLEIPGSYNIRDLGGYETRDGNRTRWGRLLRADSLHRLDAAAQEALLDYGLRTVIDLRKSAELQNLGHPFMRSDRVTWYHQNMVGDDPWREGESITRPEGIAEIKRRSYSLILDKRGPQVRETLSLLALPDSLPALFHCSAGTDRTGMIAALVLGIAGVPREVIGRDYSLSGRFLLARYLDDNPEIPAGEISWQEYQARTCPPEVMLGVLEDLDERHGGVEGYARAIGLGDPQIEALREAVVEQD